MRLNLGADNTAPGRILGWHKGQDARPWPEVTRQTAWRVFLVRPGPSRHNCARPGPASRPTKAESRCASTRVRLNASVRPVAQPSRRRVPAPSRCEDDEGGETPPSLAGGDACATNDSFNRTQCGSRRDAD